MNLEALDYVEPIDEGFSPVFMYAAVAAIGGALYAGEVFFNLPAQLVLSVILGVFSAYYFFMSSFKNGKDVQNNAKQLYTDFKNLNTWNKEKLEEQQTVTRASTFTHYVFGLIFVGVVGFIAYSVVNKTPTLATSQLAFNVIISGMIATFIVAASYFLLKTLSLVYKTIKTFVVYRNEIGSSVATTVKLAFSLAMFVGKVTLPTLYFSLLTYGCLEKGPEAQFVVGALILAKVALYLAYQISLAIVEGIQKLAKKGTETVSEVSSQLAEVADLEPGFNLSAMTNKDYQEKSPLELNSEYLTSLRNNNTDLSFKKAKNDDSLGLQLIA